MTHYLYLLTNKDLNKIYVGVTIDPLSRLKTHLKGNSTNYLIKEDRELYTFEMEIIAQGSHDFIYNLEIETIELLNTIYPAGYNLSFGGFGGCTKNTAARGENQGHSILKDKDILEIRTLYNSKTITQEKIAKIFNTSRSNISTICSGKSWSHVKGPLRTKSKRCTDLDKQKIFNLSLIGTSTDNICKIMGCSESTVKKYKATKLQIKEEVKKQIKSLLMVGISIAKISKVLNKGETTIRKYIKELK